MSIINWPRGKSFPGFSSYTLKLVRKSVQLLSPFTGRRQVVAYPFALWNFSGKFSTADLYSASMLRTFFAQLNGAANKFRMILPEYKGPSNGYTGAAPFYTSGSGNSITVNCINFNTQIWLPGDYFTIADELKVVRNVVTTDGSGNATVNFDPPLRATITGGVNDQIQMGAAVNIIGAALSALNNAIYWILSNCTIANTPGAAGPFGGAGTAPESLIVTASAVSGFVLQQKYVGNLANRTFTGSVYVIQNASMPNPTLLINDTLTFTGASVLATLSGSWTRYSVSFTWPASSLADTIQIALTFVSTGAQSFYAWGFQLEEATSASATRYTSNGEGPVTALMALTADDGASWDLSPPILYQFSLDAQEAFE